MTCPKVSITLSTSCTEVIIIFICSVVQSAKYSDIILRSYFTLFDFRKVWTMQYTYWLLQGVIPNHIPTSRLLNGANKTLVPMGCQPGTILKQMTRPLQKLISPLIGPVVPTVHSVTHRHLRVILKPTLGP